MRQRSIYLSPRQRAALMEMAPGVLSALRLVRDGQLPRPRVDLPRTGEPASYGGLYLDDEEWAQIRARLDACPGWTQLGPLDAAEASAARSGPTSRSTSRLQAARAALEAAISPTGATGPTES